MTAPQLILVASIVGAALFFAAGAALATLRYQRRVAPLERDVRELEAELAAKAAATRDLALHNEQLEVRLREALAVRAAPPTGRLAPRPARGTDRQVTASERTTGEALARVIERFADRSARSSALGDRQGFPLASTGGEGVALAAYAALLFESASRAKEFLPIGTPSSIEIVDRRGVRVAVWSLEVESERLILANLAATPVDTTRLEAALGDLTQILAPAARGRTQPS